MPSHTPAERARNAPIRARQRRRNSAKAAKNVIKGQPPKTAGLFEGLRRFIPPFARNPVALSAAQARAIRAPRNSAPMSSFEKVGGISGRHNTDHNTDHG